MIIALKWGHVLALLHFLLQVPSLKDFVVLVDIVILLYQLELRFVIVLVCIGLGCVVVVRWGRWGFGHLPCKWKFEPRVIAKGSCK